MTQALLGPLILNVLIRSIYTQLGVVIEGPRDYPKPCVKGAYEDIKSNRT